MADPLEPLKKEIEDRVRAATRQEFIKMTIAVWLVKQLLMRGSR